MDRSGLFADVFANWQAPAPDYIGQVARRVRQLGGLLDAGKWQQALTSFPDPRTPEGLIAAREMLGGQQGMWDLALNWAPVLQTVYHGSPHKWAPEPGFPAGRPRLDKIGTGQGAQSYARGIYFAGAPATAETYLYEGLPPAHKTAAHYLEMYKTPEAAADALEAGMRRVTPEAEAFTKEAIRVLRSGEISRGKVKSLDLPDEILPDLLDWDKPLSQQSEKVRKALTDIGLITDKWPAHALDQWTGAEAMSRLGAGSLRGTGTPGAPGLYGSQEALTRRLSELGIPGLSYLDAGSRRAGDGTRNFVIWDQGLLDEMGRRMAKAQGLLPEQIPDELPAWAPAARMAQWRTARANAALPVEQGGLGLGPANTAAERAGAMGFDVDALHGTTADIQQFRPELRGTSTQAKSAELADWLVNRPETAAGYADMAAKKELHSTLKAWDKAMDHQQFDLADELYAKAEKLEQAAEGAGQNVMPLMLRGNLQNFMADGNTWSQIGEGGLSEILKNAKKSGKEGVRFIGLRDDAIGIGGGNQATHYAMFNPANIRSRFAAFDPKRRNEADLLASWLLPALFGGAAVSGGLFGAD